MSIYSALVLAANEGVEPISPHDFRNLLNGLSLIHPEATDDDWGNLADNVVDLFRDAEAQTANDRFFRPQSISLMEPVEIHAPDGDYSGPGWCVQIHGYGYFFPWELSDLQKRVVNTPALLALQTAVEQRFGGRFTFPETDESRLRARLIDGKGAWTWFASESF